MIEVKDLKKHYGEIKAVDGMSFICPDGQITGLLGPDGAVIFSTIGSLVAASVCIVFALRLFNRERLLYSM